MIVTDSAIISCHIRCFPHIINIAVQHALMALKTRAETLGVPEASDGRSLDDTEPPDLTFTQRYILALERNPLGRCAKLVSHFRSSGSRHKELRDEICQGNESNTFRSGKIPELELLRSVVTRWSSEYFMVNRTLTVYEVWIPLSSKPFVLICIYFIVRRSIPCFWNRKIANSPILVCRTRSVSYSGTFKVSFTFHIRYKSFFLLRRHPHFQSRCQHICCLSRHWKILWKFFHISLSLSMWQS